METLKRTIEENDTRAGRIFDVVIQTLIVVSLATFSIETLPDLDAETRRWLHYVEATTVALFTLEYLLRIYVAERKLKFVFSFFGIIDLLSILPFYLASGVDLRTVRAFRLLRLFRTLKILRYSKAIRRFHRAFLIAREEFVLFISLTLLLLYFSAVGIYYFERDAQPQAFTSVFHSLWWAVTTLTTVGYGDVYPVTLGGRMFTVLVLFVGLGLVSVPAGLVASAISKAREMED
ncbi:MAG: ion transporter [Planctomycetota bacterium]|nr:ion transporter [Planctomycetota bacterium]MDA1252187.1 ion transporter [Planctomycetota bacterium]